MSNVQLLVDVWGLFQENIPNKRQPEIGASLIKIFQDFGHFEDNDELSELLGQNDMLDLILKKYYDIREEAADDDYED